MEMEKAAGRAVLVPIAAGEPLLTSKVSSSKGGGLASLIPKGMRAYTIETSSVASNVAGFVLPGNFVDVHVTLKDNYKSNTGGSSAITLLQAVEILAVDQNLDSRRDDEAATRSLQKSSRMTRATGDSSKSVTLLVTPEQATDLDLAQNSGKLSLALRNPADESHKDSRTATLNGIRHLTAAGVLPIGPPPPMPLRDPLNKQDGDSNPAPKNKQDDVRDTPEAPTAPTEVKRDNSDKDAGEKDKSPVKQYEIRTLRGSHTGRVRVHAK